MVSFVEHFRPYLWGVPFTPEMDHWSLEWLMTSTQQNSCLARWALKLQEYDFKTKAQKGAQTATPTPCSARPCLALEMLLLAHAAAGDGDDDRITYAAEQGGSDSGGDSGP